MAKSILVALNFNDNEIRNVRMQQLAAAPSTAVKGKFYFNTVTNKPQYYDGTDWKDFGTGGGSEYILPVATASVLGGIKLGEGLLGAADGTTSVNASVDTTTNTIAIKGQTIQVVPKAGGSFSGSVGFSNNKITSIAAPTENTDAANKYYVDQAVASSSSGFHMREPVNTVADLPQTGNTAGDARTVLTGAEAGHLYIWTEVSTSTFEWKDNGALIDMSAVVLKANLATSTGQATDTAMTQKAATDAFALKSEISSPVTVATGSIAIGSTSATISFNGTLICVHCYNPDGEEVVCDVDTDAGAVVVSIASALTYAIGIQLTYIAASE